MAICQRSQAIQTETVGSPASFRRYTLAAASRSATRSSWTSKVDSGAPQGAAEGLFADAQVGRDPGDWVSAGVSVGGVSDLDQ
jgi:hypothetical protein